MSNDLPAFLIAVKRKLRMPILKEPGVLFLPGQGAITGPQLTTEQWQGWFRPPAVG